MLGARQVDWWDRRAAAVWSWQGSAHSLSAAALLAWLKQWLNPLKFPDKNHRPTFQTQIKSQQESKPPACAKVLLFDQALCFQWEREEGEGITCPTRLAIILCLSQLSNPQNGNNVLTDITDTVWKLNEIMFVTRLSKEKASYLRSYHLLKDGIGFELRHFARMGLFFKLCLLRRDWKVIWGLPLILRYLLLVPKFQQRFEFACSLIIILCMFSHFHAATYDFLSARKMSCLLFV